MTGDGSKTIFNAEVGECYHSKHGAVQESKHVFIKMGLEFLVEQNKPQAISILEIGFGTGLNFLQTLEYMDGKSIPLHYLGVEAYPLPIAALQQIGYDKAVQAHNWDLLIQNYENCLLQEQQLTACLRLEIAAVKILSLPVQAKFDLIYFDAFAAIHQPEMWSDETLAHVTGFLKPGGVFVTYAITGNLKRSMKALGFSIQKVPGAPGKREMLRAIKQGV